MKYLLTLIISSFAAFSQAQNAEPVNNYTFMKVCITNDDNDILLVKYDGQWEVPGAKYNIPVLIPDFLRMIAQNHGFDIEGGRLFGMYTQKWKTANYLSIMHYYHAHAVEALEFSADVEVRWATMQEAKKIIPYPHMLKMIDELEKNGNNVLSAAFLREKNEEGEVVFEVLKDWYYLDN